MNPKLLKIPEAAIALRRTPKTIYAWVGARKIAVHRINRSVLIPESEIQRIISEGFVPVRDTQR